MNSIEIMSHRQWKVALATPGLFDVIRPLQFCREALPDPCPGPGWSRHDRRTGRDTEGTCIGTEATQRCDSRSCQNNTPRAVRCRRIRKNVPIATAAALPIFSITHRGRCDDGARGKSSNRLRKSLGHGDGLSELLKAESEKGEADGGDGQELGPDGLESGAAEDDGLREGDKVTRGE